MDVVVVGAGPTGLMVACELALAGVRCTVLERRAEQGNLTRAFGVHARALELLDGRGMADELVARGVRLQRMRPAWVSELDLSGLDSRYPMLLVVPQSGTERMLEQRAAELGVQIVRGAEVIGLRQDSNEVRLDLADGTSMRAAYVVGADGAHSTVRELLDVGFVGEPYEQPMLLADVRLHGLTEEVLVDRSGREGVVLAVPFGDGWFRVGAWLRDGDRSPNRPPDAAELRAAFHRIAGTDFGMSEPRWISRFVSESRQARHYRVGRVFLAGDAAHVHSPMGGQGMNTGLQDAINLGWKLGATVRGWAPPWLLDSYHAERHPVGAQVLKLTERLTRSVVDGSAVRLVMLRLLVRGMLGYGPVRRRFVSRLTGLGIRYRPGMRKAHRLAGRRAPDWATTSGRLYEHLREGRFVLLDTTGTATTAIRPWSDRVLSATPAGRMPPGAAALVRPDGYVAWAGERVDVVALRAAMTQWCGPAAATSTP